MFHCTFMPRFNETDALGHINNTVIPVWFEEARRPIFEIFIPGAKIENWNLIFARLELEILREIYMEYQVEVRTSIDKIGNSSFVVAQEVWQQDTLKAQGRTTLVHFDYQQRKSKPIPQEIRQELQQHLTEKS